MILAGENKCTRKKPLLVSFCLISNLSEKKQKAILFFFIELPARSLFAFGRSCNRPSQCIFICLYPYSSKRRDGSKFTSG